MNKKIDLTNISREEKEKLLKKLLLKRSKSNAGAERGRAFPLSVGQQGLWLIYQRAPLDTSHHIIAAFRLKGSIDQHKLINVLNILSNRHELLACRINEVSGVPCWRPLSTPVDLDIRDVSVAEYSDIGRKVDELSSVPFDLCKERAWRAQLLESGKQPKVLLLTFHHIITDGWSLHLLKQELIQVFSDVCEESHTPLPPVGFHYRDYVAHERLLLKSAEGEAHKNYWLKKLAGDLPILDIATDHARSNAQRIGGQAPVNLSKHMYQEIIQLAGALGVTPFTVVLTAYAIFLLRYSHHDEVVIGFPVAQRGSADQATLFGYLVNMVAIRIKFQSEASFNDIVDKVNSDVKEALAHRDYPFQRVVKDLGTSFDYQATPVFQTVFNLMKSDRLATDKDGKAVEYKIGDKLTAQPIEVTQSTSQFDLMLELIDSGKNLNGFLKYDSNLFSADTALRYADNFLLCLESLVTNRSAPVIECRVMSDEEKRLVSDEWCALPDSGNAGPETIIGMFDEQYAVAGSQTALVHGDIRLTYEELGSKADSLALTLQKYGHIKNSLIGLYAEPGIEMIVAILAIMKSGGAYVPLNPTHPEKRIDSIIEQAKPEFILRTPRQAKRPLNTGRPIFDIRLHELDKPDGRVLYETIVPDQLAYVLFTSGSTGMPKGVMIEHRNVVSFLKGFNEVIPLESDARGMMITPFTFDASVWEIYGMLCFGGTLYIPPNDAHYDHDLYLETVHKNQITSVWVPPSSVNEIVDKIVGEKRQTPIKRFFVGAAPISQATLRRLKAFQPEITIINGYGPTETTVVASLFRLDEPYELADSTPIGRPIRDYRIDIVDRYGRRAPIGVSGEIIISGAGVGRGYLGDIESEIKRYAPNPWFPYLRSYRTGDLGRWLPDGNIDYIGRVDNQIKILGTRIEPGEVNTVVTRQAGVIESAVLVNLNSSGAKQLVAFVVIDSKAYDATDKAVCSIRAGCRSELPRFMVPARYIIVDEIPHNENGKIESKALLAQIEDEEERRVVAAETAVEQTLLDIWKTLLKHEDIGVTHDFFELGGDSLLALQIASMAQSKFDVEISVDTLFSQTTIRELACVIDSGLMKKPAPPIERVSRRAYIKG